MKRDIYFTILSILFVLSGHAFASPAQENPNEYATATFAGGCFWCMETAYEGRRGIKSVVSGYMGGTETNPTYRAVSSGQTGHAEVIQIKYSPKLISYQELLSIFWRNIDPFAVNRQFCDRGSQYRTTIFVHNDAQRHAANASIAHAKEWVLEAGEFQVPIVGATTFYAAEDYHQDYYRKNPAHYAAYRKGCRRDARLQAIWGKYAGDASKH